MAIVQLQCWVKQTLTNRLQYDFKEMEETSSLQSLEELKHYRSSLCREEEKKGISLKNLAAF